MEIAVKFETITPLYTGDAWQNCKEIKPSSIMGSLRFWFEVLCYFNEIINDNYFDNGVYFFINIWFIPFQCKR
jgi:CRISPR-associated protein Cmr1